MTTPDDGLLAYDREHLWHPYTSMTDPLPVRQVVGADGVRIRLADGTELVFGGVVEAIDDALVTIAIEAVTGDVKVLGAARAVVDCA